jgi:hypothetical protein
MTPPHGGLAGHNNHLILQDQPTTADYLLDMINVQATMYATSRFFLSNEWMTMTGQNGAISLDITRNAMGVTAFDAAVGPVF